jgi:hypothetical protein
LAGIAEFIDAPRLYTKNLPQGASWKEVKKLLTSINGTSPVQRAFLSSVFKAHYCVRSEKRAVSLSLKTRHRRPRLACK